jgi:hypothetical protein
MITRDDYGVHPGRMTKAQVMPPAHFTGYFGVMSHFLHRLAWTVTLLFFHPPCWNERYALPLQLYSIEIGLTNILPGMAKTHDPHNLSLSSS